MLANRTPSAQLQIAQPLVAGIRTQEPLGYVPPGVTLCCRVDILHSRAAAPIPGVGLLTYGTAMFVNQQMRMMKRLVALSSAVVQAASHAPDNYPQWMTYAWTDHRVEIDRLWADIFPSLENRDYADCVDALLKDMLDAFNTGNVQRGRKMSWDLWILLEQDKH